MNNDIIIIELDKSDYKRKDKNELVHKSTSEKRACAEIHKNWCPSSLYNRLQQYIEVNGRRISPAFNSKRTELHAHWIPASLSTITSVRPHVCMDMLDDI